MLFLYRCLLHLYPVAYRYEYGDEMAGVFRELQKDMRGEMRGKRLLPRGAFLLREFAGLLNGALQEHSRAITGSNLFPSSSRRFTMRSEFRFPKATPVLMTIILAGVILTIEKATAIQESLPYTHPRLPPIQPERFTFFPAMAVIFLSAYAAAVIGWIVLFALRRSGVHRLSEMPDGSPKR